MRTPLPHVVNRLISAPGRPVAERRHVLSRTVFGVGLFVALDLVVSSLGLTGAGARQRQEAINKSFRVAHDVYHHSLTPKFSGMGEWGRLFYQVRTNDLGFIDSRVRSVAKVPHRSRIVLIGDSFTEGLGMPWEQTFAGIVAKARPDLEVLNAGVTSYSPIVYYRKLAWLIEQGYRFDHAFVMIDVSDTMDETAYVMKDGAVAYRDGSDLPSSDRANAGNTAIDAAGGVDASSLPAITLPPVTMRDRVIELIEGTQWALSRFHLTSMLMDLTREAYQGLRIGELRRVSNFCRSAWTYNHGDPRTDFYYRDQIGGTPVGFPACPAPAQPIAADAPSPNIDRANGRAIAWMTKLHELLAAHGIALTVGVYPWPAQIFHHDVGGRYERMWQDWCRNRCAGFVTLVPDFAAYARAHPRRWYPDLFIYGDVHYSARGNQMVALRLQSMLPPVANRS